MTDKKTLMDEETVKVTGGSVIDNRRMVIRIDVNHCTGCMNCANYCPVDAITEEDGYVAKITDGCIQCENCFGYCPNGAIDWGYEN